MNLNKITISLDAALPICGYDVGHQVTFTDGIPTIDDGLAFYISQLSNLEAKIYEAKYTNINFQELIPINTNVPEWADTWDYISYDAVTLGKFIGSNADDLPSSDINATKSTVPIGYAGNSYSYSLDELRKSQQLRIPLDTTKGRMSLRGAQEHMQRVAYFGDSERGMFGLFNNPNVAVDNSTTNWATASGQEVVNDMNQLFIDVWIDSANVHVPNVLVLDSDRFAQITSQRMDSGTDTTVFEFFMANNLYTSLTGQRPRVIPRLQLIEEQSGGNLTADRMMAYELNDENLSMVNPIPWRSLAPQMNGLKIKVPAEYKLSGVEVRYLASMKYRNHI